MQKLSKADLVNTRQFRDIFKESDIDSIAETKKARPNGSRRHEKMGKWRKIVTQFSFFFHFQKKIIDLLTDPYRVRKKRECICRLNVLDELSVLSVLIKVAAVGWCVSCVKGISREDRMLKIDPLVFLHLQFEFFKFLKKIQLYCYISRKAQKVNVSGGSVGLFLFLFFMPLLKKLKCTTHW